MSEHLETAEPLDRRRRALSLLHYGLTILTARSGEERHAATVSWVMQTSFNPQMIAVCLRKNSRIYNLVSEADAFVLNIVPDGKPEMAEAFFKLEARDKGDASLAGYAFQPSQLGLPILTDAAGWIEARVIEEVPTTGDHAILVALVLEADAASHARSLALRDTPWHYSG